VFLWRREINNKILDLEHHVRTMSMSLALQCDLMLNKVSLSWVMTRRCKRQSKVENFMWSMRRRL